MGQVMRELEDLQQQLEGEGARGGAAGSSSGTTPFSLKIFLEDLCAARGAETDAG